MRQRDRIRLSMETGLSLQTIINWERGKKTLDATDIALRRAVKELQIQSDNAPSAEASNGR